MSENDLTELRLASLPRSKPFRFRIEPDAQAREDIANSLDISGVRKLRFAGTLSPERKSDWHLEAELGATVVQPCVATLEPVTTRIDEKTERRYVADLEEPEGGAEVEMPEDDSIELKTWCSSLTADFTEACFLAASFA